MSKAPEFARAVARYQKLLATPRWNVREMLEPVNDRKGPSLESVKKIAALAGLRAPEPRIVADLQRQLVFIDALDRVDTTGVEPLARLTPTLVLTDLDSEDFKGPAEDLDWQPTSLASEHQGPYYVVKRGRNATEVL